MADAPLHRSSGAPAGPASGRDARIEQLLLAGLDEYFAGRYEQAIHVWTRVLFLDRGHARARAYIERARRALAERLRESEELFHRGADAFNRGDARTARELLTSALARGTAQEDALALLGRLDRLEASAGPSGPPTPDGRPASRARARAEGPARPVANRLIARPLLAGTLGLAFLVGGGLLIASWPEDRWTFFEPVRHREPTPGPRTAPIPVPTAAETAVARARQLVGSRDLDDPAGVPPQDAAGLQEALRLLESVRLGDPRRLEADELRARIQRALIAGVDPRASAGSIVPPGPSR